ncbi:MAG: glycosyltransferase family 1 protein [Chlorobiaceae bacterium]
MKIALYSGTYVKNKDGAVKSIYQLVSSFKKNSDQLCVWSPDVSSRDDHNGVSVYSMPSMQLPLYPDYKLGFFTATTHRQLERFSPDIVHISTPDIIGRKFLLYAHSKSLPVVSVFHTDFPSYLSYFNLGFAEKLIWRYLTWFYNKCDVVFAPNESVLRKLEDKKINNVAIWSRGIDRELFHPLRRSEELRTAWNASGRKVIVYAGRFVHYKDVEIVMRVYERFIEAGYSECVRFVLIGSGPAEEEMKQRMPEAVFTGYLTGSRLSEAYASGDIFFFPSTTEAFCNVALEALSSGLPAIVSNAGGCRNIIDKSGGGLVARAGDVEDFFGKCRELYSNFQLYEELRAFGLAYAEKQSWATVNSVVIDCYKKLAVQPLTELPV